MTLCTTTSSLAIFDGYLSLSLSLAISPYEQILCSRKKKKLAIIVRILQASCTLYFGSINHISNIKSISIEMINQWRQIPTQTKSNYFMSIMSGNRSFDTYCESLSRLHRLVEGRSEEKKYYRLRQVTISYRRPFKFHIFSKLSIA